MSNDLSTTRTWFAAGGLFPLAQAVTAMKAPSTALRGTERRVRQAAYIALLLLSMVRAARSPADCACLGRLAEDLGFDVVSVFGDLGDQPPLPALLAIAQSTHRVRVGPACLNPYTTHPVEIAGQIAALDFVSTGRAYL